MTVPHPFVEGANGRCAATPDGDILNQCGRAQDADLHLAAVSAAPRMMAGPAEAVGRVRSVPAGRKRRSMPWNELPWASKAVFVVGASCVTAVLLCLVATLCRLILSAGGWLG